MIYNVLMGTLNHIRSLIHCTPTRSSVIRMSHTWLCLPSWYSFTDPGGMEGWVGLGGWLWSETVYLPKSSHPSHY